MTVTKNRFRKPLQSSAVYIKNKNKSKTTRLIFTGSSVFKLFKYLELLHHFQEANQTTVFRNCILASENRQKSHISTAT